MQKLFLTSIARNVIDKFITYLDAPANRYTIGFIPTAGNCMENPYFIEYDKQALIDAGFQIIVIDIAKLSTQEVEDYLESIDILFLAGGNTFFLLQEVNRVCLTSLLPKFFEKGGWLIGSSAGSVITGKDITFAQGIDDQTQATQLTTYTGMKLINTIIIPHWSDIEFEEKIQKNLLLLNIEASECTFLTDTEALLCIDGIVQKVHS